MDNIHPLTVAGNKRGGNRPVERSLLPVSCGRDQSSRYGLRRVGSERDHPRDYPIRADWRHRRCVGVNDLAELDGPRVERRLADRKLHGLLPKHADDEMVDPVATGIDGDIGGGEAFPQRVLCVSRRRDQRRRRQPVFRHIQCGDVIGSAAPDNRGSSIPQEDCSIHTWQCDR